MSAITKLPPLGSLSRPTTFEADMDGFYGALPRFRDELNAIADGLAAYGRNLLDNPMLQVAQRFTGSTAVADDAYALDRWYILTQTASVNVSQLTDPEVGYTHAMRLAQNQAGAQRMGFAQVIEGARCKHARGQPVTLTPRIRCSAAQAIRYALLGWTGTEDQVTSDVVNDWTNGGFTPGNFFKSTSMQVHATGVVTPAANTWTTLDPLTHVLSADFNNLIVMVWTEGVAAQNVTLDVDAIQLELGSQQTPWERLGLAIEQARCRRRCRRYGGFSLYQHLAMGWAASVSTAIFPMPGEGPMASAPAVTSTSVTMNDGNNFFTIGTLGIESGTGGNGEIVLYVSGSSGLSAGQNLRLMANNSLGAFVQLSCDL